MRRSGRGESRGKTGWTRREVLRRAMGGFALAAAPSLLAGCTRRTWELDTLIARVSGYGADLGAVIGSGLKELGVKPEEIRGKRILLKPNMIEPRTGLGHINTHPAVVRAAAEAFLRLGASRIVVAEGSGNCRDSMLILEESGMQEMLVQDRIPFVDLNYDEGYRVANAGRNTRLAFFTLPVTLRQVDWVVSVAKMKTHHWAGVTLSMKNLFGLMPGIYYGWPKNVLHWEGIIPSILDINATCTPHFAIVDGIVGMEGDGPIMGAPKKAGILVMGRNPLAVDSTSARAMGIDPGKVPYLDQSSGRLGSIRESEIRQRGESVAGVRTDFALLEQIEAQRGIRWKEGTPG